MFIDVIKYRSSLYLHHSHTRICESEKFKHTKSKIRKRKKKEDK